MSSVTLLPPNASELEYALAEVVARISEIPVPNADLYNPELCLPSPLPWLAWAFSVDEWKPDWTIEQKRQSVANSVYVHRHKGTVGALKSALSALGYNIELVEWQQLMPQGDPYTFGLNLEIFDVGITTQDAFDGIVATTNNTKNARSHMTFFDINTTRNGPMNFTGVPFYGATITIPSGDA